VSVPDTPAGFTLLAPEQRAHPPNELVSLLFILVTATS
jgi:hypothetical protein